MTDTMMVIMLSMVLIYLDFRLTKTNYGAVFNGIGAIPYVLSGQSRAPMQYRVLVPWTCSIFGVGDQKLKYLKQYVYLRWLSILFAVSMSYFYYHSVVGVLWLVLFFVAASLYDYTDVYIEIGLLALALVLLAGGYWWALIPITAVAALNRETAIVIPTLAFFDSSLAGIASLCGFAVGYLIPRIVYGAKDRYCSFWMVRANIAEAIQHYKSRPFPYVEYTLSVLLFGFVVYSAICGTKTGPLFVGLGLFAVLLIPAKWREIRVFAPCVFLLIGALL